MLAWTVPRSVEETSVQPPGASSMQAVLRDLAGRDQNGVQRIFTTLVPGLEKLSAIWSGWSRLTLAGPSAKPVEPTTFHSSHDALRQSSDSPGTRPERSSAASGVAA